MLIFFLLVIILILYLMAKAFQRTIPSLENPQFVLEKPPMPRQLASVMKYAEKWKEEGRLSREDFEKLSQLILEDAKKEDKPTFS